MHNDSREPCGELGASLKLSQLPERVDIGLLNSVLCVAVIAKDCASGAVETLAVTPHQHLELLALSSKHSADRPFIWIRGRGLHDPRYGKSAAILLDAMNAVGARKRLVLQRSSVFQIECSCFTLKRACRDCLKTIVQTAQTTAQLLHMWDPQMVGPPLNPPPMRANDNAFPPHHARELELVLATVSHELRRPLAAILGWTRLLRSGRSADIERGLEVIERSANQQRLLIEELLDLSRASANAPMETFSNIDVNDVLRNVADAAQPTAAERKVQLVADLADHPMVVRGDARRLHQIFGNLVSNAIKFTQASGTVSLLSRSGCDAVVEVADTGVGISACELPRIFEPFWRADADCTLSHEGLGLGLAIVRRFVELHGGTIEARSDGAGCGTCMIVRLPLEAEH